MKGKLYSVGVGPGDPELMTLKAVRLIRECDVLAIPQGDSDVLVAKNIVEGIMDLSKKEQLLVYMPMVKDHDIISKAHQKGADDIIKYLDEGKNVVFITLGCPTVYATCIYVHKLVLKAGYEAVLVPGVTSFCAVAAKLNVSLCEKAEPLTGRVRDELTERGLLKQAQMIENCGLPGEKIYKDLSRVDDKSSYFSVILVKEKEFEQ